MSEAGRKEGRKGLDEGGKDGQAEASTGGGREEGTGDLPGVTSGCFLRCIASCAVPPVVRANSNVHYFLSLLLFVVIFLKYLIYINRRMRRMSMCTTPSSCHWVGTASPFPTGSTSCTDSTRSSSARFAATTGACVCGWGVWLWLICVLCCVVCAREGL